MALSPKDLPQSPHGELLRALLPPVSYDPNAERVARSLTADGLTLDRVHAASMDVLNGLRPFQFLAWMERYEEVYGLPMPCFYGPLTMDERILQLAIALKERAGISASFYYWLAEIFGYSITIEEFTPFVAGSCAGQALSNGNWKYAWSVRTLETPVRQFRAGRNSAGDPLKQWGDERFECLFKHFAPAHVVTLFAYGQKE